MKKKTFEDKLMELEAIIAELENGTSTLDDSFNKYKEAMDLLKSCDEELKGVMAHEFGHINNYDGQITLLVTFCTTIFVMLCILLLIACKNNFKYEYVIYERKVSFNGNDKKI